MEYLAILRDELLPALECTEPIAIAYASAYPAFEFHLGKAAAMGDGVCEVCFKKVK